MTLGWIIETLKKDGINSKGEVRKLLENASIYELRELRNSIQELINKKELEER